LSLSKALRPEYGPEENNEDVPSDSKVLDDCLRLARALERLTWNLDIPLHGAPF
jgi:hypothetical protein